MSNNHELPFLNFELPKPSIGNEQPDVVPLPAAPAAQPILEGTVSQKYEVTVEGVQKQFSHLSLDEIFYPPHQLFDAALARQIALHIMHYELSVPRRRLAEDLARSREMLSRALRTVETRRASPEFERVYREIAADVRSTLHNDNEASI